MLCCLRKASGVMLCHPYHFELQFAPAPHVPGKCGADRQHLLKVPAKSWSQGGKALRSSKENIARDASAPLLYFFGDSLAISQRACTRSPTLVGLRVHNPFPRLRKLLLYSLSARKKK
jgi:hypothetical protein